jgi:hypothetical protein
VVDLLYSTRYEYAVCFPNGVTERNEAHTKEISFAANFLFLLVPSLWLGAKSWGAADEFSLLEWHRALELAAV